MHLRLFHKLFFLVALTALVASLAMAAVMSWNLSRGFEDYLQARDSEALDSFVVTLSKALEDSNAGAKIGDSGLDLKSALPSIGRRRGDSEFGRGPRPRIRPRPDAIRNPPRRGNRRPPIPFDQRILLFDTTDRQVTGPPPPPNDVTQLMQERQIIVDGQLVGMVRLLPRGPAPDSVDTRFLRSQYIGAAILVAVLIALAAGAAFWIARRGALQLSQMQRATDAITNGDFTTRVDTKGYDEVAAMGKNINSMAESLDRLDTARRRWLAEIGHELRTPLTVLTGELDALKDGVRPINREAIESLSDETRILNRLVEDLHFLAISDLSGPLCHFEPDDAVALIQNAVQRFTSRAEGAGLALIANVETGTSLPVNWDASRIDQLLNALLVNSLRYTDAPGKITLSLDVSGTEALIRVEDSAPAVAEEHLQHLFEPLYRVEEARDRESGGSGLGLAVCKKIVEAHGGKITAQTSGLGGLSILIQMPLNGSNQ